MAIPKEILAIERPKNTRVKKSGNKYIVIKRTCVRRDGRNIPVELGKIGEIVDGKYFDTPKKEKKTDTYSIKEYGITKALKDVSNDVFEDLIRVYGIDDAKTIYTMSILRSSYGNVTNRDLKFRYDTSYISETIPGIALSENTVSKFIDILGRKYHFINEFMNNRLNELNENNLILVDGMLKNSAVETSDFTQWSRKSKTKGSESISILYAVDTTTGEPLAEKVYPGNMLDQTSFNDFLDEFKLENAIIIGDKGTITNKVLFKLKEKNNLSYLFPLKRNDNRIQLHDLYLYESTFTHDNDTILYKKKEIEGMYFYSFKNATDEARERKGYLTNQNNKETFDIEKFNKKEKSFGSIVFISDKNIEPRDIYTMYDRRWEIENFFNFYKNVINLESIRVQDDTSIIGSEFINFISSLISIKFKNSLREKNINKKLSYKQIVHYLTKIKKIQKPNGSWINCTTLRYISELGVKLDVI